MNIHRPWMTQVELVRGCNMRCDFCANVSLPKEKEFMTVSNAIAIASAVSNFGDRQRLAFAMRGEPTLHPDILEITRIFRAIIPEMQLLLVTNGTKCSVDFVKNWFAAGGNIVSIDCYHGSYGKFFQRFEGILPVKSYRDFNIWQYHSSDLKLIVLIDDLIDDHANSRTFTNQADWISDGTYDKYKIQRPDVNNPLQKKCALPFRELAIHYNGNVPLCCKDWVGARKMYNVIEGESLVEWWYKDKNLNRARALLLNKCREFYPCNRCTYFGGFRLGLLPKVELTESKKSWCLLKLKEQYGSH